METTIPGPDDMEGVIFRSLRRLSFFFYPARGRRALISEIGEGAVVRMTTTWCLTGNTHAGTSSPSCSQTISWHSRRRKWRVRMGWRPTSSRKINKSAPRETISRGIRKKTVGKRKRERRGKVSPSHLPRSSRHRGRGKAGLDEGGGVAREKNKISHPCRSTSIDRRRMRKLRFGGVR